MKLPNSEIAVVDLSKLTDYVLNVEHEHGKHKARVFHSAMGLTRDDAEWLRELLLTAARTSEDVEEKNKLQWGQLFQLDFPAVGLNGDVNIRSAWIVETDESFPRLVSCYILED